MKKGPSGSTPNLTFTEDSQKIYSMEGCGGRFTISSGGSCCDRIHAAA